MDIFMFPTRFPLGESIQSHLNTGHTLPCVCGGVYAITNDPTVAQWSALHARSGCVPRQRTKKGKGNHEGDTTRTGHSITRQVTLANTRVETLLARLRQARGRGREPITGDCGNWLDKQGKANL